AIELAADRGQLAAFEFDHAQATPAFSRADQRSIHQFGYGAFIEGMRDDLVRRRSSLNNRSSMLVVQIARRCASGKRRWAMHASKSSCRHASTDGRAAP